MKKKQTRQTTLHDLTRRHEYVLMMGDRLNIIIDYGFESFDAFDAILPIIFGPHIFTEYSSLYTLEGNAEAYDLPSFCPCFMGHN